MIINFTNYYDQTQAIGLQDMLSYSGCQTLTPYPLLIALSKSVEYSINLAKTTEYSINLAKTTEYSINLAKTGGGL